MYRAVPILHGDAMANRKSKMSGSEKDPGLLRQAKVEFTRAKDCQLKSIVSYYKSGDCMLHCGYSSQEIADYVGCCVRKVYYMQRWAKLMRLKEATAFAEAYVALDGGNSEGIELVRVVDCLHKAGIPWRTALRECRALGRISFATVSAYVRSERSCTNKSAVRYIQIAAKAIKAARALRNIIGEDAIKADFIQMAREASNGEELLRELTAVTAELCSVLKVV